MSDTERLEYLRELRAKIRRGLRLRGNRLVNVEIEADVRALECGEPKRKLPRPSGETP